MALKLLKGGGITKEAIKEISKEVRLLRGFNHPNIVRFYGAVYDKVCFVFKIKAFLFLGADYHHTGTSEWRKSRRLFTKEQMQ